ncbi:MAG: glycosyltransferase family 2 protein, partial [Mesorhizobium sp.]
MIVKAHQPLRRDRSTALGPAPAGPRPERSAPEVSFIICTRNRVAVLDACIKSVQAAC